MNPKELYHWAAQILTLDEFPGMRKNIINRIAKEEIPLDRFIKCCDKNFIIPAIYLKLKKHNILAYFPREYTELLKHIYELNKKRNQLILKQIKQINKQLKENKICPVYLKGTAHLLDDLYADTGERMIGDIDFLVREEDFFKTARLLMEMGYQRQYEMYDDINNLIHYPPLYRDDAPAAVEIHRIPVLPRFATQFTTGMVRDNSKKILTQENGYVPSDAHKIIQNFIHSQLSHRGYLLKWNSLRDLYDLYLLAWRKNPVSLVDQVEQKDKIKAYFGYASALFKSEKISVKNHTKSTKRYIYACNLFLEFPALRETFSTTWRISRLLFVHYPGRLKKTIFQKNYRSYLLRKRLSLVG